MPDTFASKGTIPFGKFARLLETQQELCLSTRSQKGCVPKLTMVLARLSGSSAGILNRHKVRGGGLVRLLRTLRLDDNLFRERMICVMQSSLKSEVADKNFD